MTVRDLLQQVRDRGITLKTEAGEVVYRARRGVMTPELRAAITNHRDEIIALLKPEVVHEERSGVLSACAVEDVAAATGLAQGAVDHLLAMPLGVFAREGQLLEVRVPWLTVTLWFAPTDADGERLVQEGISRGRIWTPRELDDLLSCAGLKADQVKAVALAKLELGGDVVEVHRR